MNKNRNKVKKAVVPMVLSLAMVANILPMKANASDNSELVDTFGNVATPTDANEYGFTKDEQYRLEVAETLNALEALKGLDENSLEYQEAYEKVQEMINGLDDFQKEQLGIAEREEFNPSVEQGLESPTLSFEDEVEQVEGYFYILKEGKDKPLGTSHSGNPDWDFFGKGVIDVVGDDMKNHRNTADVDTVQDAVAHYEGNYTTLKDTDRGRDPRKLNDDEMFVPIRLMWGTAPEAPYGKSVWHVDGVVKPIDSHLVTYHYGLNLEHYAPVTITKETNFYIRDKVMEPEKYNVAGYKFLGWATEENGEAVHTNEELRDIKVDSDRHFWAVYEPYKLVVNHVYPDSELNYTTEPENFNPNTFNLAVKYFEKIDTQKGLYSVQLDGVKYEVSPTDDTTYVLTINYDKAEVVEEESGLVVVHQYKQGENVISVEIDELSEEDFKGVSFEELQEVGNFEKATFDRARQDFVVKTRYIEEPVAFDNTVRYRLVIEYEFVEPSVEKVLEVLHVYHDGKETVAEPQIVSEFNEQDFAISGLFEGNQYDSKNTDYEVMYRYAFEPISLEENVVKYSLIIHYSSKENRPIDVIAVNTQIDNAEAGKIISDENLEVHLDGADTNVNVTWKLNEGYKAVSITINGEVFELSSENNYKFDAARYAEVGIVNVVVNTEKIEDEEIEDDKTPEIGGENGGNTNRPDTDDNDDEVIEDDETPEIGGDEEITEEEEILDDVTPEVGGEEEIIEDETTPEVGNKDIVTDTGVASTMPWMLASLVSLGAMVAELIRRKRI